MNNTAAPIFPAQKDGLATNDVKEWSKQKLYYLENYLARFINSMRGKQWRSINYIDLFSGAGKGLLENKEIIIGSPLIALSQARSFDNYFFSDNDAVKIDALKARCSVHPDYPKITFAVNDANIQVKRIAQQIRSVNAVSSPGKWSDSLNLAFLDPYGLELHWETVNTLAFLRTDMIIYYSQMGITREAPLEIDQPPPTKIDEFFGDTKWRAMYQKYQQKDELTLHRQLLDYYKSKLGKFGYKVSDPLPEPLMKNSKDAPLYRLLFVSKHDLGNKFWSDVNTRRADGQLSLF